MRGRGALPATNLRLKTLEKQALNGPPLVTFECVPALDVKKLLRHVPRPPTLTYVLLTYVLEMPESRGHPKSLRKNNFVFNSRPLGGIQKPEGLRHTN